MSSSASFAFGLKYDHTIGVFDGDKNGQNVTVIHVIQSMVILKQLLTKKGIKIYHTNLDADVLTKVALT